jgi:hypothetical protein
MSVVSSATVAVRDRGPLVFWSTSTMVNPEYETGFGLAMTSGWPVIRTRSANTMRYIVTDLAAHICDALPRRFCELAVFDARLYIRVRRIDEPV